MADEAGGLLVQIGVTQARMERELAKVVKDAAKAAKQAEDSFTQANDNIGKGGGKAFNAFSKGASAAAPAVKNVSGYTANLASQLNDISVQLAGGQSPFQIMLQQGTQIGQIAAQAGGGLQGLGSLLVGAFKSVLSPVNLLTFAIIGLGGYAVQYFSKVVGGGEDANRTIEEQARLIEGVAKTWGDVIPALQAYLDVLAHAKDGKDLQEAAEIVNGETVKVVKARIGEIITSFQDLISQLQAAGEESDVIYRLQDAFDKFTDAASKGKDVTNETKAVQSALSDAINSSGIPAVSGFADIFNTLAGAAASAAKRVSEVNDQVARAANGPGIQDIVAGSTFSDNGKTYQANAFVPGGKVPTPGTNPLRDESLSSEDLYGKPKKGSTRGANAYKDEVAGIKERTAALQASTAAQAAINPLVNDYGYASAKAAAEQRLLADAERSKMKITPQLRDDISSLAGAYAEATAGARKLAESQDEIRQRAEEWASLEKDVLGGFITDLSKGKSAADAFADALGKIGNRLLDMALDDLFSTKSGAGGGSDGIGTLLGGIGKALGFASGTANTGGKRGQPIGVVHGQEAVIPLPAGGKVPVTINTPNASDLGGGRSGDVHVSMPVNIDATGADAAGLARVEAKIDGLKRTLPTTIVTTVKDGQRRRLIQ